MEFILFLSFSLCGHTVVFVFTKWSNSCGWALANGHRMISRTHPSSSSSSSLLLLSQLLCPSDWRAKVNETTNYSSNRFIIKHARRHISPHDTRLFARLCVCASTWKQKFVIKKRWEILSLDNRFGFVQSVAKRMSGCDLMSYFFSLANFLQKWKWIA